MKRFLFLTDTHYRLEKPKSRIDNIWTSQVDEMTEIGNMVHDLNIDALLHGGDFFDRKNPPHELVVDLINWCQFLQTPFFSVIGNHDITGYNLKSVRNSALGVLFESSAVEQLDEEIYEKEKLIIRGAHCQLDHLMDVLIDKSAPNPYLFPEKYDGWTKIVVSHNYVIPSDSMPFGFVHPKDIPTNADLVLCGHYHVPFDYQNGKTRWLNPGAIARWSMDQKDRVPTVIILEVDEGTLAVIKKPLTSAKPASSLFDLEQIAIEEGREADIASFVKSLEQTSFQSVDIEQEVKRIGAEQKIPTNILSLVVDKIREAKDTLK
jgi:exonuclease SbcD